MDDLESRVAIAIGSQMDDSWDYDRFWKPHTEVFDGAAYAAIQEILTTHTITPIREPVHGTIYTYTKKRCRCDECRAANRDYSREYRAGLRREARKHG